MAEHKKETEAELEGIGEEAPPPYTDIVGWMAARGLEAEDEFEIDMTANAHESVFSNVPPTASAKKGKTLHQSFRHNVSLSARCACYQAVHRSNNR